MVGREVVRHGCADRRTQAIGAAKEYHGPNGSQEIAADIYGYLAQGGLSSWIWSVGSPSIREELSKKLVRELFQKSSSSFNAGDRPPRIVILRRRSAQLDRQEGGAHRDLAQNCERGCEIRDLRLSMQRRSQFDPSEHLANTENSSSPI